MNPSATTKSALPGMFVPTSADIARGTGATREKGRSARISALDFTKGVLVLFMVLYHWLNYFYGLHGVIYRYLRFLPPSFIFISGFLISNAYLSKYDVSDSRLPRRLTVRGFKILGVFVVLNLLISFFFTGISNLNLSNAFAVYVTGNVVIAGIGKAAAFYILVPISYLLLLSAALVILCRHYKHTFYVAFGACLMAMFLLSAKNMESSNLELVTIGLLGLMIGYIPIEKINVLVKHPYPILAGYACYSALILFFDFGYILQVMSVVLTLMLIYILGVAAKSGHVAAWIILLGKYSLLGYIAQLAILQVLRAGYRHASHTFGSLILSFVAAVALTSVTVLLVDRIRMKSPLADAAYKAVFN